MSRRMCKAFLFLMTIPIIHGDWVKIESLPQKAEKFEKAETWGNNSRQEDDDERDSGVPRSPEGKIMILRATHDRLVNQIYNQVEQIGSREARGLKGGMGSKEGALITISLLTFAVYLIKLVLMLIHAVHEKKGHGKGNQFMNPTALPTSVQTLFLNQGRRKRSAPYSLLEAMNDLNFS